MEQFTAKVRFVEVEVYKKSLRLGYQMKKLMEKIPRNSSYMGTFYLLN